MVDLDCRLHPSNIAWTSPVRQMAAELHSCPHLRFMLEWLPSGHCTFGLITLQGTPKEQLKKNIMQNIFNFISIVLKPPLEFSIPMFFFNLCPSNYILDINDKFWNYHWGLLLKTVSRQEKQTNKRTQFKPDANSVFPIGLASHIQPQLSRLCGKSCRTTTSPNTGEGPPYWNRRPPKTWHLRTRKNFATLDTLTSAGNQSESSASNN